MKTLLLFVPAHMLLAATLTIGSPSRIQAQHLPDIVWSTNCHSRQVNDIMFSATGAYLLSGSADRSAKLWDVPSRSLERTFAISGADAGKVTSVALSPESALIAVVADGGEVRVWQVSDGQRLWSGQASGEQYRVRFAPNDSALCYGTASGITVVTPTGVGLPFENPLGQNGNERGVFDVAYSPDGKLLASGNDDNTASLFLMPQGVLFRDLTGHSGKVTAVDFSPDGSLLATAAADGSARLWQATNGVVVRVIQGAGGSGVPFADGSVGRIKFSTDGKSLLTSSNGTLRFWRVSDGQLLLTYTNLWAGPIAVSPDGKHFAYGTDSIYGTNAAVVLARWPLLVTGAGVRTNAMHLDWQGGTGLYQIEQRTNLSSGAWEAIAGPITNTKLQVPLSNSASFFRIQSLTNSP